MIPALLNSSPPLYLIMFACFYMDYKMSPPYMRLEVSWGVGGSPSPARGLAGGRGPEAAPRRGSGLRRGGHAGAGDCRGLRTDTIFWLQLFWRWGVGLFYPFSYNFIELQKNRLHLQYTFFLKLSV